MGNHPTPGGRLVLETVPQPDHSHRDLILDGLASFNADQAGASNHRPLCILLRNEAGHAEGGLWGATMYDWLVIELLLVPEASRDGGIGAALLRDAEAEAQARGCIGAWLDTFSFQARGFYEKLGYALVGTIPDHPRDGARHFMMKRWAA
jgi:GNAT superfamily N-acetyltransferase